MNTQTLSIEEFVKRLCPDMSFEEGALTIVRDDVAKIAALGKHLENARFTEQDRQRFLEAAGVLRHLAKKIRST